MTIITIFSFMLYCSHPISLAQALQWPSTRKSYRELVIRFLLLRRKPLKASPRWSKSEIGYLHQVTNIKLSATPAVTPTRCSVICSSQLTTSTSLYLLKRELIGRSGLMRMPRRRGGNLTKTKTYISKLSRIHGHGRTSRRSNSGHGKIQTASK